MNTDTRSVEERALQFLEYRDDGYNGGKEGLRCSECDSKYRGTSAIRQLCPVCKARELFTQLAKEGEERGARKERESRDALFQETNVKKLLDNMEDDAKEYGQYHDPDCPQMSEWADADSECECEVIKAMKHFATEWVGKANEMWVTNLQHHRKHCTPEGNKDLTRIRRKIQSLSNPPQS